MHELSLMEEVRRLALAAAAAEGATRIQAIELRVGEQAGVEPEALRFAFPVVMDGTIAANAELRITAVPATARCAPCGREFACADGLAECPHCGSISRQLLSGRELELASLELELPDGVAQSPRGSNRL
ncbi:MAG: hydrogenase maturation nickel metallochaperone HypA [Vulcanococcus sp.]